MKHGSLFTGIGGFDYAAELMGWDNLFQCEKDEYCNALLKQNFPNTIKHGDIKETNFSRYRGSIDVLSGGFPCQPYSSAGKRKGTEDERHLWPEMLRVIREVSPRWVVGENVRGLTNWNGGLVFDEVQSDLEAAGYEVTPFLLPAAGVNAPHRRDRIWFIAHSTGIRCRGNISTRSALQWNKCSCGEIGSSNSEAGFIADANNATPQRQREYSGEILSFSESEGFDLVCPHTTLANANDQRLERNRNNATLSRNHSGHGIRSTWDTWPTQSAICGGNDGVPNRVHRLKALGNAVVPQVVYQIFKAIEEYERLNRKTVTEVRQ